jgi:hypothetical protein
MLLVLAGREERNVVVVAGCSLQQYRFSHK